MALPIGATPVLSGKAAVEFLRIIRADESIPAKLTPTPKLAQASKLIQEHIKSRRERMCPYETDCKDKGIKCDSCAYDPKQSHYVPRNTNRHYSTYNPCDGCLNNKPGAVCCCSAGLSAAGH